MNLTDKINNLPHPWFGSRTSTGGDNDWYEFSDVGKIIIMKMLVEKLNMTISELCLNPQ